MMKPVKFFLAICAMVLTMAQTACSDKKDEPSGNIEIITSSKTLSKNGGEVEFTVLTPNRWTYTVTPEEGVTEEARNASRLKLRFPANASEEKAVYTVEFNDGSRIGTVTVEQEAKTVVVKVIAADLLDVVFNEDGSATDRSPMRMVVKKIDGPELFTYYNDNLGRYVANFSHELGSSNLPTGFYRIDYDQNEAFKSKLYDGCTLETVIMCPEVNSGVNEIKWFSSMERGGIGFLIPRTTTDPACSLTFLPNISENGASNWRWTHSGVTYEPGKYYHVVGVYDKGKKKSFIYVNGELKGESDCPGEFVPAADGARWFTIGGDASTTTVAQAMWNGDICIARIYSEPLDATDITDLYLSSKVAGMPAQGTITSPDYLPVCQAAPGSKYNIYGKGFKAGDKLQLCKGNTVSQTIGLTVSDGFATAVIPEGMASGTYAMIVDRDGFQIPLGKAEFIISNSIVTPKDVKIIAHRGVHNASVPENSVAALELAMDKGCYGSETDVWITTDGKAYINHDGVINGITIQNSTSAQLANVKLGNGEKLPTLDDYIAAFKAKMNASATKMIIEIKTHSSAARNKEAVNTVLKAVKDAGITDRVEYIAFDFEVCRQLAADDTKPMVGYLEANKSPADVLAAGIKSIDYQYSKLYPKPEWIAEAHQKGMIVNVWTVNTAVEMLRGIGLGVDYITTNEPDLLKQVLSRTYIQAP